MKFKINKEVFKKLPNLIVYIPIIYGFDNSKSEKNILLSLKIERDCEAELKRKYSAVEELKEQTYIKSYFACFKEFGEDPIKNMPTHFALAKRVVQGKDLPNINPIVNIYNSVSIKYLTPFGGEDLQTLYGDFELRFANGDEHWLGIGETAPKSPAKGNLIWQDDFDVSTISLNWRQCDRTKLTEFSTDGYFIMDGFKNVNDENLKHAAEEFINIITKNFGGRAEMLVLDIDNPEAEIDFKSKGTDEGQRPKVKGQMNTGLLGCDEKEKKQTKVPKQVKVKVEKSYTYPENSFEARIQELLHIVMLKVYSDFKKSDLLTDFKKTQMPIMKTPDPKLGDYSTSIAMQKSKDLSISPIEFATKLEKEFNEQKSDFKAKAIAPGFLNFTISESQIDALKEIISLGNDYGKNDLYKGEVWDFENLSPNPNKALHIGHLRNNLTGMAIARLGEFSSANVIYDCIDNDRGIAIAKLMWGFLKFGRIDQSEEFNDFKYWYSHQAEWVDPTKEGYLPDRFMDSMYVKGARDFEEDKKVEEIVRNMVVLWEAKDELTWALWKVVLDYSHEGQRRTLKRLGNRWDNIWHESDHYQMGKDFVDEGLKKGIFIKDNGAIVTNLKEYNIPNTVVIKSDGTSLYITQDLALNMLKKKKFNADKMFWVIGPEQALAMKQVFAVSEQLGIGKVEDFTHIAYGYMTVNGQGKMSSRKGNVLFIDDLIDTVNEKVMEKLADRDFSEDYKEELSEKLALAAIKYNTLRVARMTDVSFDIEASTDFNGDTAIYVLYSLVRAKSVLSNSEFSISNPRVSLLKSDLKFVEPQSEALYKKLLEFPSIIHQAVLHFAPNYVCLYMFQLAQLFNQFYDGVSIMKEKNEDYKVMKLLLLKAYEDTISNGCRIIGIEPVTKM